MVSKTFIQTTIPSDRENQKSNKNNALPRITKTTSTKGQTRSITFYGFSKNRFKQTQIQRTL